MKRELEPSDWGDYPVLGVGSLTPCERRAQRARRRMYVLWTLAALLSLSYVLG